VTFLPRFGCLLELFHGLGCGFDLEKGSIICGHGSCHAAYGLELHVVMSCFFPYSNFNWAMNFIGIALIVGLAACDANRIKALGGRAGNPPAEGGWVVIGALALSLDFFNLFLLLLKARNGQAMKNEAAT
jgi:FtsH-binding integral membrane protein